MQDIRIDGARFRDRSGRQILLRGVNLGGDCKVPAVPDGRTFLTTDFADHRRVSFVGRPFSLDAAGNHFRRLKHWGFNCVRLLTTWEAVEHAGPGQYDSEYLEYLTRICEIAGEYGIQVFIDFHQDVWSRMSGGDGAPGWTFEAAGLDFSLFDKADAALVMQYRYDQQLGGRQASYPVMSWGGNYSMPANALMWTFFWAGGALAPDHHWQGRNIQDVLQDCYLGAMAVVARSVAHLGNVIGFDTLNEPGPGLVGKHLTRPMRHVRSAVWTPLDTLAAASGFSRVLPIMRAGQKTGDFIANKARVSIWRDGVEDPFRSLGVWDVNDFGEPVALNPDYFRSGDTREFSLERDFVLPFFHRVASTIRNIRPDWLLFAEISPHTVGAYREYPGALPENSVNALHWYDYTALVTKSFDPDRMVDVTNGEVRDGKASILAHYRKQLLHIRRYGDDIPGGAPTLIGECGIPFDLHEGEAYRRYSEGETQDAIWSAHIRALQYMYDTFDALLLNSTQWNYTASNRNDPMIGDGWNQEDLSIFSEDQCADPQDPDSGGRAIPGFCRPYVQAAQGNIDFVKYELDTCVFECTINVDPKIGKPTEIYVPKRQFGDAPRVELESGTASHLWDGQILKVTGLQPGLLKIVVRSETGRCALNEQIRATPSFGNS